MSLFGLHRRWRAACVGHLALFEMTSVGPMGRYAAALRRLGIGAAGRRFYDVHVEADAIHEQVAQTELVAGMLEVEPASAGGILFGARALAAVEGRFARHLLDAWRAGTTSLRGPVPDTPVGRARSRAPHRLTRRRVHGPRSSGAAEVFRDPTPPLNALVRVTPPADMG